MVKREHLKKFFLWCLILNVIFSTVGTAFVAVAAVYSYTSSDSREGYISPMLWDTETMLGALPSNAPDRLYETHPNMFGRYTLDYPKKYQIKGERAWWDVWGKTVDWFNENLDFSIDTSAIGNFFANMLFFLVKAAATVNVFVIQLVMGGEWMSGLFSLFAAITKVVGVAFLVQNFFYVAMICLGAYLIYQGLIRRRVGTTVSELILSIFLLAFTVYFVSNPAGVMRGINDATDALGTWVMQIGTNRNVEEQIADAQRDPNYVNSSNTSDVVTSGNSVSNLKKMAIIDITNKMWALQVHAPWEILQFGEIDIDLSNPTRSLGRVVMEPEEYQALLDMFDSYDLNLTIKDSSSPNGTKTVKAKDGIAELMKQNGVQLAQEGTLVGTPWPALLLGIPSEQSKLKDMFVSVLGSKGENGTVISTHDKAVEALHSVENKLFTTFLMMLTSFAMTWFIIFISFGMLMAQIIVLVSMVIGPFVLFGAALPQFGHRYVKNWALITLGAFGAKLLYYTLMAVMFLLISVIMIIFYDMNSLDLDAETVQALAAFGQDSPAKLQMVQIIILLVIWAMNKVRQKMFARPRNVGQFGLAGQIIHNVSRGEWKNTATMYGRAMRGDTYGELVARRDKEEFGSNINPVLNPLNLFTKQYDKNGKPLNKSGNKSGSVNGGAYDNISNHPYLKENEYLMCPVDNNPCIHPEVGLQNIGYCTKHGSCPFHTQGDQHFGQQFSYVRDGADKFKGGSLDDGSAGPSKGGNLPKPASGNATPAARDADVDVEFDAPEVTGSSSSSGVGLPCPVDGGSCIDAKTAFADSGSPYCSQKNCMCPYRNMADADHYNFMQQLKKKQSAQVHVRIAPNTPQNVTIEMPIRMANTPERQNQISGPAETEVEETTKVEETPNDSINRPNLPKIEVPEIHVSQGTDSVKARIRVGGDGTKDSEVQTDATVRRTDANSKKEDEPPTASNANRPNQSGNTNRRNSKPQDHGKSTMNNANDKVAESSRKYQEFRERMRSEDDEDE